MIGITFLCAQLTWAELDRKQDYETFSYVEKVTSAITTLAAPPNSTTEPEVDLLDTVDPERKSTMLAHITTMVGSSNVLERVIKDESLLATRSDPTNSCTLRAFDLNPPPPASVFEQDMVVISVVGRFPAYRRYYFTNTKPQFTTVVAFPERCEEHSWIDDPNFLVLKYTDEIFDDSGEVVQNPPLYTAVVLPEVVSQRLEIEHRSVIGPESFADGLMGRGVVIATRGQSKRLVDAGYDFLTAIDYRLLQYTVLRRAESRANRTFRTSELDFALQSILKHSVEGREVWGFSMHAATAAILMPFLILGLSISVLFRIARLDQDGDLISEPWILMASRNPWETFAANVFAVLLLGSIIASTISTWIFETEAIASIRLAWRRFLMPITDGFVDRTFPVRARARGGRDAFAIMGLLVPYGQCAIRQPASSRHTSRAASRPHRRTLARPTHIWAISPIAKEVSQRDIPFHTFRYSALQHATCRPFRRTSSAFPLALPRQGMIHLMEARRFHMCFVARPR